MSAIVSLCWFNERLLSLPWWPCSGKSEKDFILVLFWIGLVARINETVGNEVNGSATIQNLLIASHPVHGYLLCEVAVTRHLLWTNVKGFKGKRGYVYGVTVSRSAFSDCFRQAVRKCHCWVASHKLSSSSPNRAPRMTLFMMSREHLHNVNMEIVRHMRTGVLILSYWIRRTQLQRNRLRVSSTLWNSWIPLQRQVFCLILSLMVLPQIHCLSWYQRTSNTLVICAACLAGHGQAFCCALHYHIGCRGVSHMR